MFTITKNICSSTEKRIALWSLGQMAHESVIPLLISYMEGKEDSRSDVHFAH